MGLWYNQEGKEGDNVREVEKREAVAFVDYEHWFYGYSNRFQMRPNVDEWLKELKNEFHMKDIFFFGDFSEPNIGKDLERLKKSHPVSCIQRAKRLA